MTGDLTKVDAERVWLNSIRNAFTVMASIAIHVTAMFLLEVDETDEADQEKRFRVDDFRCCKLITVNLIFLPSDVLKLMRINR